jgi:phosphomannomutase
MVRLSGTEPTLKTYYSVRDASALAATALLEVDMADWLQ